MTFALSVKPIIEIAAAEFERNVRYKDLTVRYDVQVALTVKVLRVRVVLVSNREDLNQIFI